MRTALFTLVGVLAYVSTGCAAGVTTQVRYRPSATTPPASRTTVGLRIVDSRESKLGGKEKNLVGQMRGTYGNPFALREASSVSDIVAAATTDALLQAGVRALPDASRAVIVTIKKYWVDGYVSCTAKIEVGIEVLDSEERVVFSQSVAGDASGAVAVAPQTELETIFQNALAQYARAAQATFQSSAFQNVLGPPRLVPPTTVP